MPVKKVDNWINNKIIESNDDNVRVTVDMPRYLHLALKEQAMRNRKTMREYILDMLIERLS